MRAARLLPLLLLAGCASGGDVGYAVRLNMVLDPSVSDADRDRIRKLELEVRSSVESWYRTFDATGKFGGRKADLIYRPKAPGGDLPFAVRVRDEMDQLIGEGSAIVTLKPGATVDATVTIARPVPPDAGPTYDFLPGPDMTGPVDLSMPPPGPDLSMPKPDLAAPPDLSAVPTDLAMPPPPLDLATSG